MPKPHKHIFVCAQARPPGHPRGACQHKGAGELLQAFTQALEKHHDWGHIGLAYSGCLGPCDNGPNVLVYPDGVMYSGVTPQDVSDIYEQHIKQGEVVERLLAPKTVW